jgi:hypothetical protein
MLRWGCYHRQLPPAQPIRANLHRRSILRTVESNEMERSSRQPAHDGSDFQQSRLLSKSIQDTKRLTGFAWDRFQSVMEPGFILVTDGCVAFDPAPEPAANICHEILALRPYPIGSVAFRQIFDAGHAEPIGQRKPMHSTDLANYRPFIVRPGKWSRRTMADWRLTSLADNVN